MNPIASNASSGAELYAMKKAIDVQAQSVLKVLESLQAPDNSFQASSGASLTGIGQTLDIRA